MDDAFSLFLQTFLSHRSGDEERELADIGLQPDRGLHALLEPPSPILVPGVPDALQIDVYGYMRAPEATVHVRDASTIRQLVVELNSLRALPSGPLVGMDDDGSQVVLAFSYPDGSKRVVTLHPKHRQIASAEEGSGWSSRRLLEDLGKILPNRLTGEKQARIDAYRSLEAQYRTRARRTLSALMAHRLDDPHGVAEVVRAYLSQLRSEETRQRAAHALKAVADIISGSDDLMAIPWTALRYEHTDAIRLFLADRYDVPTADLYLTVLRGLLRTAWQRGYLAQGDYMPAADLAPIGGGHLWEGRSTALGNEFNARIDLDLAEFARAPLARRGDLRD